MTIPEFLQKLLKTPAFWTALVGFINTAILALFPAFPQSVLTSFNGLVVVIASVFAGQVMIEAIRVKVKSKTPLL